MSNRILWILIILWFFWIIFSFYLYFFKFNRVNIEIISNIKNYEVELYNNDMKSIFNKKCEDKKCIFEDFSPFNYKIKISKKWYRDLSYKLNIRDNWITKLNIKLEKNIYLREIKKSNFNKLMKYKTYEWKKNLEKNKKVRKFYLDNLWEVNYEISWNKLNIFNKDIFIWSFNIWKNEEINIRQIYWTNDFIFINIWEKKYIYNLISKSSSLIELYTTVKYIKVWSDSLHFRLITKNGTFIYNEINKKLLYFPIFKDFEIIWENYIWIISSEEKEKFNNFWYKNTNNENYIIEYNILNKKRDILYKTSLKFKKILKIYTPKWNFKIFIFDEKDNIYELINF